MLLLILTMVFAYLLDAVFVGAVFAVGHLRWGWRLSGWRAPIVLLMVFIGIDLYWLPAASVVDARLIIGNTSVADALGISREVALIDFFSIGWLDVLIWGGQVILAGRVANWFCSGLSAEGQRL